MGVNISSAARAAKNFIIKNLPKILLGVGIGGGIATTIVACKETKSFDEVRDQNWEDLDALHGQKEYLSKAEYAKKAIKCYTLNGYRVVKHYAPAVAIGAASAAATVMSYDIQAGRLLASVAAGNATMKTFSDYRERVKNEIGEEAERKLRAGVKTEEEEAYILDKKGEPKLNPDGKPKTKTVSKDILVSIPVDDDDLVKVFSKENTGEWNDQPDYNYTYIKQTESYFNKIFSYRKPVIFLNEVLERLGFSPTPAGQVIGWKYDPGVENKIVFDIIPVDGGDLVIVFNCDKENLIDYMLP